MKPNVLTIFMILLAFRPTSLLAADRSNITSQTSNLIVQSRAVAQQAEFPTVDDDTPENLGDLAEKLNAELSHLHQQSQFMKIEHQLEALKVRNASLQAALKRSRVENERLTAQIQSNLPLPANIDPNDKLAVQNANLRVAIRNKTAKQEQAEAQLASIQRWYFWTKIATATAILANLPPVREATNNLWLAGLKQIATWAPKK